MGQIVPVETPEQWLQGVDWDQEPVVQEIIHLGAYQFRVRRALEMYQAGAGSLGYVAEKADPDDTKLVSLASFEFG
jgi:hypothetical protein